MPFVADRLADGRRVVPPRSVVAPQTENQGCPVSLATKSRLAGSQPTRVRSVGDAEPIREPDRAQVRLDGELKGQRSRAARGIPELVLDDESLAAVRAELEALDLEAVQHRAVGEPIAVGIGDEVGAGREGGVPDWSPARRPLAQNPSISLIGWSQTPPISPGRWSPRSGKFPSWVPITYVRVPAVT